MSPILDSFSQRMLRHLKPLAERLLKNEDYHWLAVVSDLMSGLSSGKWTEISDDEKEYFLKKMSMDFHPKGMGDSMYGSDPDYRGITKLISAEKKGFAIRRNT